MLSAWFCDQCTTQNDLNTVSCYVCEAQRSTQGMVLGWTCVCEFQNPPILENCGGCGGSQEASKNLRAEMNMAERGINPEQKKEATEEPKREERNSVFIQKFAPEFFIRICGNLDLGEEQVTLLRETYSQFFGDKELTLVEIEQILENFPVTIDDFCSAWKNLEMINDDEDDDSWGDDDNGGEDKMSLDGSQAGSDDWGDDDENTMMDQPTENWDNIDIDAETMKIIEDKEAEAALTRYDLLNPRQLAQRHREQVESWAQFLGMEDDLESTSILCRYFRWHKNDCLSAMENDGDKVLKNAGLVSKFPNPDSPITEGIVSCLLCFGDVDAKITSHCKCGHQFCHDCWRSWLSSQIGREGPGALITKCPYNCGVVVPGHVFEKHLAMADLNMYKQYLANSFIQNSLQLKPCPSADCDMVCQYDFGTQIDVECGCGHKWCFYCGLDAHEPCDCHLAEKWEQLNQSDKENVHWIKANTKRCPKCKTNIEKNQGCMHMTCRQCRHEFCWLCSGKWAGHTACNKSKDVKRSEEEAATSKNRLERYMFYGNRFEAHKSSLKYSMEDEKRADHKIALMMKFSNGCLEYRNCVFVKEAIQEVSRCRRILQWSYCFGYFLADNTREKTLFEDHQAQLEIYTDKLHDLTERDVTQLMEIAIRTRTITLLKAVKKFRTNFQDATGSMIFVEHKWADEPAQNSSNAALSSGNNARGGFFSGFRGFN